MALEDRTTCLTILTDARNKAPFERSWAENEATTPLQVVQRVIRHTESTWSRRESVGAFRRPCKRLLC